MSINLKDLPRRLRFLAVNYQEEARIVTMAATLIEALAAEIESTQPEPPTEDVE